jgi:hypothetical protein
MFFVGGSYVTVDNIEFTGLRAASNGQVIGVLATNSEIEHNYIHGITRSASLIEYSISLNISNGASAVVPAMFHDNVIDNSDSANLDFLGGISHGDQVYNNVIRYVYNGMNGNFNQIYGNVVEDNYTSVSGDHCNLIFVQNLLSGTTLLAYNNIVDQKLSGCSGGATLWLIGNGPSACTTCITYAFNNLIYDTSGNFNPQGLITAGHQSSGNQGTFYIFNNTVQPDTGFCMGDGEVGPSLATVHFANNQCVSSAAAICLNIDATCINDGGNLQMTTATANGDGYADSQTYAYSPTSSTSPTVGNGISGQSYCTALMAINMTASNACLDDINYLVYDSVNHMVTHPRTPVVRPGGTAKWDIGAYQFQASAPADSTTNLMGKPH